MIETKADLRHLFGAVRDQRQRPTCLAFAATDTHAGVRDGWSPLSCEYIFYHAQRRANRPPTIGASLQKMLEALELDGQPVEAGWPYLASNPDPNSWHPPVIGSGLFRRRGAAGGDDVGDVLAELDQGCPVMLLVKVSPSFYQPTDEGVVDPAPAEQPLAAVRHAVIAVGHGLVDGTAAVLVRNSWGTSWGQGGYAWLTERFLTACLFRTATLLEDVDVSGSAATA